MLRWRPRLTTQHPEREHQERRHGDRASHRDCRADEPGTRLVSEDVSETRTRTSEANRVGRGTPAQRWRCRIPYRALGGHRRILRWVEHAIALVRGAPRLIREDLRRGIFAPPGGAAG